VGSLTCHSDIRFALHGAMVGAYAGSKEISHAVHTMRAPRNQALEETVDEPLLGEMRRLYRIARF
jgi:hypothetical protein